MILVCRGAARRVEYSMLQDDFRDMHEALRIRWSSLLQHIPLAGIQVQQKDVCCARLLRLEVLYPATYLLVSNTRIWFRSVLEI